MEIRDDLVSIHQEALRFATPFCPGPASVRDVFLHFRDAAISAGCWKSLGLDTHDMRVKMLGYRLHVVAIDRRKEMFECFRFSAHGSHSSLLAQWCSALTLHATMHACCLHGLAAEQRPRETVSANLPHFVAACCHVLRGRLDSERLPIGGPLPWRTTVNVNAGRFVTN